MPSEELFLGQMGLVRWLFRAGAAPPHLNLRQKRVRYVIPNYPDPRYRLPEAEKEAEFLRKTFEATPVEPQPTPVRKLISEPGGFDLLHFACHGAAEQNNISNGRLLLEGSMEAGEYVPAFLSAATAEQYSNLRAADNRPMVVVNACQAGRAGYKLSGIGGFAQAFLKGGAGVFVGTLWSVGDEPARVFTETLYEELLRGSNLSEAAILARRAAQQKGVATWLAYVVYGNPHMKINDWYKP
jgi:CHAT domain-containing protein